MLEMFLALFLLFILFPLILLLALSVKLTSRGPVFYGQVRVGKDGRMFKIYKFRSMVDEAEKTSGPVLAGHNDPRIYALGRFMRSTHLDEIPQLFNVLKGDMSFIGPRPERPNFVQDFEKLNGTYSNRHKVKPGITGLAQITASYDAGFEKKLYYDLIYISRENSLLFNIIIVLYTVKKVLLPWRFHPVDEIPGEAAGKT